MFDTRSPSGKLDPFAVLYEADPATGRLIPLGVTVSCYLEHHKPSS